MEGDLEIYDGIITRWKWKYFILHQSTLTYCESKGTQVLGIIHLSVATLRIRSEEPLQIIINTGIHDLILRAANLQEKIKWINSLQSAQETYFKAEDSRIHIENLRNDINISKQNPRDAQYISPEIRQIIYGQNATSINNKFTDIEMQQAKLKEYIRNLSARLRNCPNEANLCAKIENVFDELKHNVKICANLMKTEKNQQEHVVAYVDEKYTKCEDSIHYSTVLSGGDNRNNNNHPFNVGKTGAFGNENLDNTIFHSVDCNGDFLDEISIIENKDPQTSQKLIKTVSDKIGKDAQIKQQSKIFEKEIATNNNKKISPEETLITEKKKLTYPPNRHPYQNTDYEYLRPQKCYIKEKTENEIYALNDKNERVFRQIYYGIKIPQEESAKVMEMNQLLQKDIETKGIKLPEGYSFHDNYLYADAAKYNWVDALRDVNDVSPWIQNLPNFILTPAGVKLLEQGNIYLAGRDKFGNTNIFVDMNNKMTLNDQGCAEMMNAMTFQMLIVKKYCLLPYYTELYNLVVNLNNMSVWSFPKNAFMKIIELHQVYFKNHMFKLMVYNPSFTTNGILKIVTSFFDPKFMIRFKVITKGNEKEFMNVMDPSQWEKKYGGQAEDFSEGKFWPPVNLGKGEILDRKEIEEKQIMTFDIMGNEDDAAVFGPDYKALKKVVKDKGGGGKPGWLFEDGADLDQVYFPNGVN